MATTQTQEFCRISWANDAARDTWEPRISRIAAAQSRIELAMVEFGHRDMTIQYVQPDDLAQFADDMLHRGLHIFPFGRHGSASSYSARVGIALGHSWTYQVKVSKHTQNFNPHLSDKLIGELLGYPRCCIDFFNEVWCNQRKIDTTLDMLQAGGPEGPAECNILLRWLGVRLVYHLPCSFSCEGSKKLGELHRSVAARIGCGQEIEWAMEMLNWPVRYSALHGAAEIVTPFVKITASTDYTAKKHEFSRDGIVLWHETTEVANENGFQSVAYMNIAHQPIVDTVENLFFNLDQPIRILDVGCGNGVLLQKLKDRFQSAELFGIESDEKRAESARKRGVNVRTANAFQFPYPEDSIDLVMVSSKRLAECPELEDYLKRLAFLVLVYDYEVHPTVVRMTRAAL